jgi:glutaconate CoA-transferase, subunit B
MRWWVRQVAAGRVEVLTVHDDAVWTAVTAARELVDGEVCFVGIGSPSEAALVAKRTHAPDLVLVYESGAVDARPDVLPLSTGSPSVAAPTAYLGDCLDVFGALQAGRIDVGLLSAAQVDRWGNLNSTVIGGTYERPKVRLVGSGGAHDIAALVGRLVIVMPHDPRRFVERVDFITAPGLDERGRRPAGTQGLGPVALVTSRARFTFERGELTLAGLRRGFGPDDAVEGFPWEVPHAGDLPVLPDPDPAEAAWLADLLTRSEVTG